MGTNMKKRYLKSAVVLTILLIFILSNFVSVMGTNIVGYKQSKLNINPSPISNINYITLEFFFSEPTVVANDENIWVYLDESDLNMMIPNKPILPVNITVLEFLFGTEIVSVNFEYSKPVVINLTKQIALASYPVYDKN